MRVNEEWSSERRPKAWRPGIYHQSSAPQVQPLTIVWKIDEALDDLTNGESCFRAP